MMKQDFSRRDFLSASATAVVGAGFFPYLNLGAIGVERPMKRTLGRTGFEVTTLGLGGQASIQWTPAGVDPLAIIGKALDQGVNYIDTSNAYESSQANFGAAFRAMHITPGVAGYDEHRRKSLCIASKTMIRHAKGANPNVPDRTDGPAGSRAADDIKRTLSQLFGDGKGEYPRGAYIDLFFIHNLNTIAEIDAIYEGLDHTDPRAERIGALAVLRDYRDGTNRTGLNPGEEKCIGGIGISGHWSSPVMMECLQRDEDDLIDAMLIAINANDRRCLSHQHNAIPVAAAKNVGIIGMKVFSDGAMYTKEPRWSQTPADVVRTIGAPELPSRPLVEYTLSTPDVATAIIGIGQIDHDPAHCQLTQNLSAAQIAPTSLSPGDRQEIEELVKQAGKERSNWFQEEALPLGAPRDAAAAVTDRGTVRLTWQTAYAAEHAISHYEIRRNGQPVGTLPHQPQKTKAPFAFEDPAVDPEHTAYTVVTVDTAGQTAETEALRT
jgi:aryl-alcohol dehydrogenase-like predicted oxidoreductase